MTEPDKPSRWKRFVWFLERAVGASNGAGSAGYQRERFRADMYNSTDGGGSH